MKFSTRLVIIFSVFVVCVSAFSLSYYRYYPDNFEENTEAYKKLVSYLFDINFEGTLLNSSNRSLCVGVVKCDCLDDVCELDGRNVYQIMSELGIEKMDISAKYRIVKIYPERRWWSASIVSFNYAEKAYKAVDSGLLPLYSPWNGGWVYDRKISDDWLVVRPGEMRFLYLKMNTK